MYYFTDTNEQTRNNFNKAPDDLYIHEYNKYLSDLLPKLKIFSVKGRGNAEVNVSNAEKSGNGSIFVSRKFNSRVYEIEGRLFTETTNELNQHVFTLHSDLHVGKLTFSFHDSKDFFFNGFFASIDVEEGVLHPKVSITLECQDPFLYKEWPWNHGKIPLKEENAYTAWRELGVKEVTGLYQPKKIVIEYPLSSSVISEGMLIESCNSDGKVVKTIKTLPYSEWREHNKIEIYFKSDNGNYMFINGYANNSYLDISSNISDFGVLKNGFIRIKNTDISQAYAYCLVKTL